MIYKHKRETWVTFQYTRGVCLILLITLYQKHTLCTLCMSAFVIHSASQLVLFIFWIGLLSLLACCIYRCVIPNYIFTELRKLDSFQFISLKLTFWSVREINAKKTSNNTLIYGAIMTVNQVLLLIMLDSLPRDPKCFLE